jgi:hypothetical protein
MIDIEEKIEVHKFETTLYFFIFYDVEYSIIYSEK